MKLPYVFPLVCPITSNHCGITACTCSISQHCKFRECMVYLLTQLSTHSSHTAKAGLQGSALPGCPALLSSYAKVTLWYHCMYMQHITTLQVQGMYGIHPDTTQHTLIAHRKGRASRVSPTRLPCPAVIICQGDIVVSLHVHAAYHNTASSRNVWYTS